MKIIKAIFSRTTFMIIMVLLQVALMVSVFRWFSETAAWIDTVLQILSVIIVLMIIRRSRHLSSDLMWLILIILFPLPGTAVYLILGANLIISKTFRNLYRSTLDAKKYYVQDPEVLNEVIEKDPPISGQFRYISESSGFPFYRNSDFDYYGWGEKGFPVMLEEMRKAEKFIFLEYFIIEEGNMWDQMLIVLREKAKQGVDVRVMYDDMGSFMTLTFNYAKKLEEAGVKCVPFNRINPIIGTIMNHRDHRKIMVIDGKTAFSGGVNLADEYINEKSKFGKWKDNVIRIKGEAVWSFTVMFLTHWNALRKTDEDFTVFKAECDTQGTDGYIAPFGETPLDNEITAQSVYINILNQAKDYCYIYTPYLIIDTEMMNALILAAKRGVDVRLMTPGVPDKKIVFHITQSFYENLIEGGVKIYEYTPGFLHAKVFVCDDKAAVVGTVNLDYRSLYLHFENATYLYGSEKILDIRKDFEETLAESHLVTQHEADKGPIQEFILSVIRIFATMM